MSWALLTLTMGLIQGMFRDGPSPSLCNHVVWREYWGDYPTIWSLVVTPVSVRPGVKP